MPVDSLGALRRKLHSLFPDLSGTAVLRVIGEGFGSIAVCVDDRYIIRIAKNADTMQSHAREYAVLPLLQDRLPLRIPHPCWHSGPSDAFPFGLIGYEMLSGKPWTLDMDAPVDYENIAEQLAEFLSAMHSVPLDMALSAGVPHAEPAQVLVDEVVTEIPSLLDDDSLTRFSDWWSAYRRQPEMFAYTPRLLHNDLWCENILLAPDLSHVTGVIDFEQMRIGDPAAEFAALRYAGSHFVNRVRAHYERRAGRILHFDERYRAAVILRELDGLRYALRYPDADELGDSIAKVRDALTTHAG